MPKAPSTSSALSLQNVNQVLESVSQLTPPEKLLLYLKLPTGQPLVNPLKSPVNPLGSRFEITQTINWVRTHFIEDKNVSLPKQNIYAEYLEYCALNSMKPLSTADFGKVMKQVFPEVRPRRLGTRGNSRYCYSGLGKRRSLSCPYLPENLCEELETKSGKNDTKSAPVLQTLEEKSSNHLNSASVNSDRGGSRSSVLLNGCSSEIKKETDVSQGSDTAISPHQTKNNSKTRKRKISGPTLGKKDQSESNRTKQPKKLSGLDGTPNRTADEKCTTICDIKQYPPTKDKGLTCSYTKLDLDISTDLNGGKPREASSNISRSYSVDLPSTNMYKSTSRTVSVDVIGDYGLSDKDLETVSNPFDSNVSSNINLQDSGISSTQEQLSALISNSSNGNTVSELNSFVVTSQSTEKKLPLPRLRPVKISGPSQVAKIIILPSNVIKQTSGWPSRQYKPIQPRPGKESTGQNTNFLEKSIDSSMSEAPSLVLKDEPKDILNYDALPKLDALGKDALDTYLNGEGNSQELDEELLQYFKPDFSSTEVTDLSNQTVSLSHVDGLLEDSRSSMVLVKGVKNKIPTSKSSVPFYQPSSISEAHPPNRCITELQIVDGSNLLLPSPASSVVLKRQASFDSGVRDLETPLNIPPSPNTRCKLFNFTPISPRPSSPLNGMRENSKSSCDTSIQSPFISPRTTPSRAVAVSDSATTKYPARFRSVSTTCKSNSLIGNPSPISKKTHDLPSFNDLVKMSKPKNHCKLLPPISPVSTPNSPVFSFSEVRKDSAALAKTSTIKAPNGLQNNFSDACFTFDSYGSPRSKSVPAKEIPRSISGDDLGVSMMLDEKPFLSGIKSPVVDSDNNLDKMLTYYEEDAELDKNRLYMDVLNGESSFNSGDSSLLCSDDPIGSNCSVNLGRRDTNSLQSFLHSDQMPTPLDCLLGDVDMGLNGLCTDTMDVFSPGLPPMPID
nr:PREDICTED: uncharacterized protein LOC109041284 [Bemisia tabaci]